MIYTGFCFSKSPILNFLPSCNPLMNEHMLAWYNFTAVAQQFFFESQKLTFHINWPQNNGGGGGIHSDYKQTSTLHTTYFTKSIKSKENSLQL